MTHEVGCVSFSTNDRGLRPVICKIVETADFGFLNFALDNLEPSSLGPCAPCTRTYVLVPHGKVAMLRRYVCCCNCRR